ncbi:hypothetical protein [Arthrobacter sp. H14]|uniref:hypothetical protein n=1 Tax=Arthrobacter sp. H14 TaxID=1312959 RepID=UPI0004AE854A|nr:hypothetical protein [Arthrobacter sp. H14]
MAVLFILIGAITGGFGGALIMAGFFAFFTGIYVVLTGRSSWLRLPGRKIGALTLATSVVVTGVGAALLPSVENPGTNTASDASHAVSATTPTPTPSRTPETKSKSPDPLKTPTTKPEPKTTERPDTTKDEPAKQENKGKVAVAGGTALAQLATIDIMGRAPKTGYERDEFGYGWMDTDSNGCDRRIICTL